MDVKNEQKDSINYCCGVACVFFCSKLQKTISNRDHCFSGKH